MAAGVELSDLDWIALVVAMVSNIVLGFVWYSPKVPTGKIWTREMKFPADMKMPAGKMAQSMVLMVLGTFLLMFVFQHVVIAFRDAMTLDDVTLTDIPYVDGMMGGVWTWLGFFVPVLLASVSWEGKSWRLFTVNALYYLVTLVVAGAIFAWRL